MKAPLSVLLADILTAANELDDSKEDQEIYDTVRECMAAILATLEEHVGGEQDVR